MKKTLIIAAHPDDDVLGCGGIMAKYAKKTVFKIIFIAEGTTCRYQPSEIDTEEVKKEIKKRNSFAVEALSHLNINNYCFYNLPCGRLDQVPLIEINKIIENEINTFQPDTIFTHSENDLNNDHIRVYHSTIIATRPGVQDVVEQIYSYEILSSSEWHFSKTFTPNHFEVLSENEIEAKVTSFNKYLTEAKKFPHPRSREGLFTLAKYRGMQVGAMYAEAFRLIRRKNNIK